MAKNTVLFLMDFGPQVFPSVAGEDEDDVKYALTEWRWKPLGNLWRSRWRSVGLKKVRAVISVPVWTSYEILHHETW